MVETFVTETASQSSSAPARLQPPTINPLLPSFHHSKELHTHTHTHTHTQRHILRREREREREKKRGNLSIHPSIMNRSNSMKCTRVWNRGNDAPASRFPWKREGGESPREPPDGASWIEGETIKINHGFKEGCTRRGLCMRGIFARPKRPMLT